MCIGRGPASRSGPPADVRACGRDADIWSISFSRMGIRGAATVIGPRADRRRSEDRWRVSRRYSDADGSIRRRPEDPHLQPSYPPVGLRSGGPYTAGPCGRGACSRPAPDVPRSCRREVNHRLARGGHGACCRCCGSGNNRSVLRGCGGSALPGHAAWSVGVSRDRQGRYSRTVYWLGTSGRPLGRARNGLIVHESSGTGCGPGGRHLSLRSGQPIGSSL